MPNFVKAPAAVLDYEPDWSEYLADSNDTIASSSWTADPGVTLSGASKTATTTLVRVTGGTRGKIYAITNSIIMTPSGQQDQRTLMLQIEIT